MRAWVKRLLAPNLKFFLRRKFPPRPLFDDSVSDWSEATVGSTGYAAPVILERVRASSAAAIGSDSLFERDSVLFERGEYSWPLAAAICLAAARSADTLRVIDFGGSLGSTFFQHRLLLDQLGSVSWTIVEQPHFVKAGLELMPDGPILFREDLEASLQEAQPNLVLFGSSLQYLQDPTAALDLVARSSTSILVLDRLPVWQEEPSKVSIQKVPKRIYEASYPAWIFSESELLRLLGRDWSIGATYDCIGGSTLTRRGSRVDWRGFLCWRDT